MEKEMATHSSILAWKISWTEEPGGLQSMRLQELIQLIDKTTTTTNPKDSDIQLIQGQVTLRNYWECQYSTSQMWYLINENATGHNCQRLPFSHQCYRKIESQFKTCRSAFHYQNLHGIQDPSGQEIWEM